MDMIVEDGLDVFLPLIDYEISYTFPNNVNNQKKNKKLKKKLPPFSDTDFGLFVRFFKKFEKFAEIASLTKGDVCMLLDMELSTANKDIMIEICRNENIKKLIDIEKALVTKLFKPELVEQSMKRLLMESYQQKKIHKTIKEFENRCLEVVIASLSFNEPVNVSNAVLISRLLSLLPEDLRERCREAIDLCDIESTNIKEAIEIIYDEESELDIERASQEYCYKEWLKDKDYPPYLG